MAQRLAGDIFSQGIIERDNPDRSLLVDYFPEFRDFTKPIRGTINTEGPRKTGGMTGVPAFGGFKPLQHNEMMPTKLFAGAKATGYAKPK
jgi:hypothetical protein